MKKIGILFSLFLPSFLFAQSVSGEIVYEEKMNIHKRLTGERERFKEFVPEFRTSERQLTFSDIESYYKRLPRPEGEQEFRPRRGEFGGRPGGGRPGGGRRGGFRGRMGMGTFQAGADIYKNVPEDQKVDQREFMGRKFLIVDALDGFKWKMSGETKTIMGYPCMKAISKDTATTIVAWFSPQIPVSNGPGVLGGLPGMILEADINDGLTVITPKSINLKALEEDTISKPKEGKKVTEEQFRKIVEDKIKEMRQEYGGNSRRQFE